LDISAKNNAMMDKTIADLQQLQNHSGQMSERELAKLRKAAQDFESIFISQILKNMRKTIPESGLFGNGLAGEFYTSMFDENIANTIAGKGGLRIADTLIESLTNRNSGGFNGLKLKDYNLRPIKTLPNPTTPVWDRSIVHDAAKKYKLDPKLVEAVIKVESAGEANAISNKGAVGLMQLMKPTAEELGVTDRYDPRQNVFGGSKYLRQLLSRFDGNLEHALAAYNAGPGAVKKYNGIPPYKETIRYVEKVLNQYQAM